MKKILLFCITALLLGSVKAQNVFSLQLSVPDTSSSIFFQNLCSLRSSEKIPYDLEADTFLYRAKIRVDSTAWNIKFSGTNWISMGGIYPMNHSVFHELTRVWIDHHFDLIPMFYKNPGLFDSLKNGAVIQLRYNMYISINDGPYYNMYSNIEDVYIPPASMDDINAWEYLKSNAIRIERLLFTSDNNDLNEKLIYIRDHFPSSVLAKLAAYNVIGKEYIFKRDTQGASVALDNWSYQEWLKLIPTKSEFLDDWITKISTK
jgi:hypothetical protein